jgi:hypothetical protein
MAEAPPPPSFDTIHGWVEKASGGHKISIGSSPSGTRERRASSSEKPSESRLSGILGNMRTGWDKRYLVLKDRVIYYYKYEEDAGKEGAEKGTFDCTQADFVLYPPSHQRKANELAMSNPERDFTLRITEKCLPKGASAEQVLQERARWISALKAACANDVTASVKSAQNVDVPLM